ncbi:MAG: S-layer protein [Candidatus Nanohaloarchaea archaeon]|nr:S-layer protein [Candidatus Nanohaloarchaea archaeon]
MKIKHSLKKVGAVAGSALMVGMTMGAAQATANTLGDFPQPFVNADGQVQSQIVVGSQGQQADVVGAINVASALGNAAVAAEEKTETVSAGTGVFGWSASGGTTLDTVNDQLYFNDNISAVRDTLTSDQVEQLHDVTFQDDSGDETDIEFFLYPGDQQVQFGKPSDRSNQDPVLYVDNPADPSASNYLYRLQANMEDEIGFNTSDVEDEEIQLFGDTYTVSTDTTGSELHLLGSQQTVDIDTGSSKTVTVGGSEVTIEAVSASDSDTGSFRVNGELKEKDEEQTVTVNGQEIRLDEVVQTGGSDSGTGVLQFAIGSDEIVLQDGQQIEDDDGDDIDGTYVEFNGGSGGSGEVSDLSTIDVYVGSNDDNHEYVTLAEDGQYTHPLFEDFTFHFGGLNPDAGAGTGGNVDEVSVTPSGDDTVTVDFTAAGGSSASVEFVHNASGALNLADDDGDTIHVVENETINEDEYFSSDAGDFPHLWEVTNIDRDSDNATSAIQSSDEAEISLKDTVSGSTVTVDLDAESGATTGSNPDYADTEVIDGQTYKFLLDGSSSGDLSGGFRVAWGDSSAVNDGGNANDAALDTGNEVSVYAPVDAASGEALAFTDNATLPTFPSYSFGTTAFNTSFVDREFIAATGASGGDPGDKDFINITPTTSELENITVKGTEDANGGAYTVWADRGGSKFLNGGSTISVSINSSGWGIINLGTDTGANVTQISLNETRGSGSFNFKTSGTFNLTSTSSIGPISNVTRTNSFTLELPSTESTDAKTTTVDLQQSFSSNLSSPGHGGESITSNDPVTVGQQQYTFTGLTAHQSNDPDGKVDINLNSGGSTVTKPSLLLVEPEDDNDEEHAYTVTPDYDSSDDEVQVTQIDSYTGSTRTETSLESDDDVNAGYDVFGTHTLENSDGQGSVTFHVPSGQATAGAAFTGPEGDLSPGGGGGTGSVTYTAVTGMPPLSDLAMLDEEVTQSVRQNSHLILVGGPAVNQLVADLAQGTDDDVWTAQQWRQQSSQGNARINLVNNAFTSGQDALIVAGFSASDTRGAARYLSNYAQNQAALQGKNTVSLSSADYPG